MDDISNRTLALLLVTAIVVSLGTTVYTLNVMSGVRLPTGRAGSELGEVNLSVESAISILLWNSTIDFGVGFVNTTGVKAPLCTNWANLSIRWAGGPTAGTYADTGGSDCWNSFISGQPTEPTHPFTIENEGNQNVTLFITGPTPLDFFNNEAGLTEPAYYNLSWQGENMEANACSVAGDFETGWTTFSGAQQTVCANERYGFVAGADDLAINIAVQIPTSGLSVGTEYKNSSITILAT